MFFKGFDALPEEMKNGDVKKYYEILKRKKVSIFLKRLFDFILSLVMLVVLSPVLLVIAILIKTDSKGPVIFRQERVTTYGRIFRIYKFRTMYCGSEKGTSVTVNGDPRVTKIGRILRKFRLDELPQLMNIIKGDMSFVGTRPEVKRYVDYYSEEMYATLLLPAGVTSLASIKYKDEERLLSDSNNADYTYVNEILPEKMKYNLRYITEFSIWRDLRLMVETVLAVIKKDEALEEEKESVKR